MGSIPQWVWWALAVPAVAFMFVETGWLIGMVCLVAISLAVGVQVRNRG
jgi:hypothetical protein